MRASSRPARAAYGAASRDDQAGAAASASAIASAAMDHDEGAIRGGPWTKRRGVEVMSTLLEEHRGAQGELDVVVVGARVRRARAEPVIAEFPAHGRALRKEERGARA